MVSKISKKETKESEILIREIVKKWDLRWYPVRAFIPGKGG